MLPRHAELQRAEAAHADDHVAHGVPDLRLALLPEHEAFRRFAPEFAQLCAELAAHGVPETIQHDDLHHANVYDRGGRLRVLDWGDASVAHAIAWLRQRDPATAAAADPKERNPRLSWGFQMGDPGFEPGTSALSERRSNQLS